MLPVGWHTKHSKTGRPYFWKGTHAPIWESPCTPSLIVYHTNHLPGNFLEPFKYADPPTPSGIDVTSPLADTFVNVSRSPLDFDGWVRTSVPFLDTIERDVWGNAKPPGRDVREWALLKPWTMSTYECIKTK